MASSILPRGVLGRFILDKPLRAGQMRELIKLMNRDLEENGLEND